MCVCVRFVQGTCLRLTLKKKKKKKKKSAFAIRLEKDPHVVVLVPGCNAGIVNTHDGIEAGVCVCACGGGCVRVCVCGWVGANM